MRAADTGRGMKRLTHQVKKSTIKAYLAKFAEKGEGSILH